MNKNRHICQKIRELRESLGMSQSQFSEIIDISENGLGKIEREINTPNMETLYKISERIGISVEILLSPKKNPPQGKSKA